MLAMMDETFPVPGMNTVRLILSLRKKCTGELDYGDQSRMFKNSKQKIFFSSRKSFLVFSLKRWLLLSSLETIHPFYFKIKMVSISKNSNNLTGPVSNRRSILQVRLLEGKRKLDPRMDMFNR